MLLGARQFFEKRGAPTPPLPYDAEVEYLESTGTQWIDTGVSISDASLADVTWNVEVVSYNDGCMGAYGSGSYSSMYFNMYANKFYMRNMRVSGGSFTGVSGFNTVRFSGGNSYLNGTAVETDIPLNTKPVPTMYLFAYNRNGTTTGFCKARVSSSTVKVGEVLIADFIPVRFTNEQGVSEGAMYDRVSGQLFRNAGTGNFIVGRDTNPISARSYVNDGLVAMWDGIENAGWGAHDATASINWPSLIDATYSNRVVVSGYQWSFGTDGAKLVGTRAIVLTASNGKDLYFDLSNDATICVCETLPQTLNSNNALNFGFVTPNAARHFLGLMCGTDGYYAGYRQNIAGNFTPRIALNLSNGAKVSVSIVWHASTRTFDAYVGWTYIGTSTAIDQEKWDDEWDSGKQYKEMIQSQFMGTWSTDDRCGTYHNLRVYSRALTSAEIAANYAIDKARFNLP